MLRGGSWRDTRQDARLSARNSEKPDKGADDIGFRIALGPDGPAEEKKPK